MRRADPAHPPGLTDPRVWLAIAAAAGPSLLAYNVSPSPTVLNQALAVALWGGFVALAAPGAGAVLRPAWALFGALALLLLSVLWSWGPGALPAGLALSALGLLTAAAVLAASGAGAHGRPDAAGVFAAFCIGWVVAGVLNVGIAMVQVFAPELPDGSWIASSSIPGRAVGNLRQPNHLSSLLLWSAIAVVALVELGRLGRRWGAALFALMVLAVVLTASRTGLLSVGLLALWGLFDRRLARPARALLLAAPLVYALAWFGLAQWAAGSQHTFGGAARLAETDISGSRFGIWANSLALIRAHPWAGVGFGEFNFAWTLTPFPGRPTALFDHTHNLPLQLAVELGLPLAAAVLGLLLWGLGGAAWRAFRAGGRAGSVDDDADIGLARRCAVLMVLMIGLHSLLEYPLWYAYFLLPAAWAFAFALGRRGAAGAAGAAEARPSATVALGGALLVLGALLSLFDYQRVAAIFSAGNDPQPLEVRVVLGQRSVLFAHHADYAAATTESLFAPSLKPFERARHYLLDTRLMLAWAKELARQGRVAEARYLADRLREFRNPGAQAFFDECNEPPAAAASAPFHCQPAVAAPVPAAAASAPPLTWRSFLRP